MWLVKQCKLPQGGIFENATPVPCRHQVGRSWKHKGSEYDDKTVLSFSYPLPALFASLEYLGKFKIYTVAVLWTLSISE